MIPEYPVPDYYLRTLEIDMEPELEDTIIGSVSLDFEMTDPVVSAEPAGFKCEANLEFTLYVQGDAPWETSEDGEAGPPVGNVDVVADVFVPGDHDRYEQYYDSWADGEYQDMDAEFIHHLESGILENLLNPIGQLLSNSYNGLIPRMRFSEVRYEDDDANE